MAWLVGAEDGGGAEAGLFVEVGVGKVAGAGVVKAEALGESGG